MEDRREKNGSLLGRRGVISTRYRGGKREVEGSKDHFFPNTAKLSFHTSRRGTLGFFFPADILVSVVPFSLALCVARSIFREYRGSLFVAADTQIEISNEIFSYCHFYSKLFRLAGSFIFYDTSKYLATLSTFTTKKYSLLHIFIRLTSSI